PSIRIQSRVAQIFVSGTMKVLGSTLRHNAQLTAGRATILRLIVGIDYLHLLRSINTGNTNNGTAATGTDRGSTVKSDQRILHARAVDLEGHTTTDCEVEVTQRRATAQPRNQRSHIQRIASVEFLIADLLARNLSLQYLGGRRYIHLLRQFADGQGCVQGQRSVRTQRVMTADILLEAFCFRRQAIVARSQICNGVMPLRICSRRMCLTRGLVEQNNLRTGNRSSRSVFDKPANRTRIGLSKRSCREQDGNPCCT